MTITQLRQSVLRASFCVAVIGLISACTATEETPSSDGNSDSSSIAISSSTTPASSSPPVSSISASSESSSSLSSQPQSSQPAMSSSEPAESSSGQSSSVELIPSNDQCDSTNQCKVTYGASATDCKDSKADDSVCYCGATRCDALDPSSSSAPQTSSSSSAASSQPSASRLRPGDPGVTFDMSKMDPRFPQMEKWITAGVRGGIPFLDSHTIKQTLEGGDSDDINAAINQVANNGGGAVLLKDGMYRIDKTVNMKSKVVLIGESRKGVNAVIYMNNGNAFMFGNGVKNSGIYRMTIEGSWGRPQYDWNIGTNANFELPNNENVSVMFKNSTDSWLDGVDLINSGDFPLRCNAQHITMRDLNVDGVHNKSGGAHGYFFILNGYNLITQSKITRLRHISLQGGNVEYNVVYDNDFRQEISYHSGDDGNNLIENNRITLPADMPNGTNGPGYRAIMGPWSTQHHKSATDNFNFNNWIHEENRGKPAGIWMSDDEKVYAGPIYDKAIGEAQLDGNFPPMKDGNGNFIRPSGGTLYPIILE